MMNKKSNNILLILFIVLAVGCAPAKFTIPVLPDTQVAVTDRHDMFYAQLNWIAKAKDSLNIPIALHVGDLVNFDTIPQFERASMGYEALDKVGLPYAIAIGNHDTEAVLPDNGSAAPGNVNANLRKTFKFNKYFPVRRFALQKGRYEPGKSDNSYQVFKAGGKKYLVVVLEFCAREGAAQWMDKIIKEHPKHKVIVLTHYHLTPKGDIATSNAGYGDMKVVDVFNQYRKPHKNVMMVLSGHVCYSNHRIDVGTQGNKIYQVLSNYQCKDAGGGYIRLLEFDKKRKTISAKMYSPYYDKELNDDSKFIFDNVKF
ncbi:MAG: metallophosphoesterase [Niabella sp.]